MKILILCTGNSCRSQMAQGWLQSFDKNLIVCSAGTNPADEVNPLAIKTMKNSGIDISNHTPKPVDQYPGRTLGLCDYGLWRCKRELPDIQGKGSPQITYRLL